MAAFQYKVISSNLHTKYKYWDLLVITFTLIQISDKPVSNDVANMRRTHDGTCIS
jgi:hypothetical protein